MTNPDLKPWPRVTEEMVEAANFASISVYVPGITRDECEKAKTRDLEGYETTVKAMRAALESALSLLPTAEVSGAGVKGLQAYDAGLLGDGGGGNVSWWQDYIRAELDRAHEFYADQLSSLSPSPVGAEEPVAWRCRDEKWSQEYWHYFTKEPRHREPNEVWEPLYATPTPQPVEEEVKDALIAKLTRALEPFANAVFNDNGDLTVDRSFATYDDVVRAYFTHKEARAALASSRSSAGGEDR
jgi:hypothetical protein